MAQKSKITTKDGGEKGDMKKNKGRLVGYFIIFVCGFLAGIAFTVYKGGSPESTTSTIAQGPSQPPNDETGQAILNLEAEVTANPDNFENWVRLGHLYYDSNQPKKAIAAYNKALTLHSGSADLLTDLGVMYRRDKQPEKAIECFDKAIKMDPSHLPARFNKGIVLMYDLHDPKGAIASWEEILKIDPQAKAANGQSISELVDKIKAEQSAKQ